MTIWQVVASADDCLRIPTNAYFSYTHTQLGVGYVGAIQPDWGCGMRFTNITIPQGATINSALLKVTAQQANAGNTANSYISAEKQDNAVDFSGDNGASFDTRYANHTTAIPPWDSIEAFVLDTEYTSPEIKTVIQEIVNRAGWVSGNALVIFWEDFAKRSTQVAGAYRVGYQWDGSNPKAPKLVVTYTVVVTPATPALTLTTYAPDIATTNNKLAVPPALAMTLAGYAPNILIPTILTPFAINLILTFYAPGVTVGLYIAPSTLSLALAFYAPVIILPGYPIPVPKVYIAFASSPLDDPLTYEMLTCAVKEIHIAKGRQHELNRMEAATLTVVLDNTDGDFYPDNAAGGYYPNIKIAKAIKIRCIFKAATYDIFEGFIDSWELQWRGAGGTGPVAIVTATGALKVLSMQVLNNAGYAAQLSGARVNSVLTSAGWPAGKRNIDAGVETMQATGTLTNVNALVHLQSVQESELSLLYEANDGDLTYEDRSHRTKAPHNTPQATFGDGAGELRFAGVKFALDDMLVYNDIRMTRVGGSQQTATSSLTPLIYSLVRSGLLNTSDIIVYLICIFIAARYGQTVSRIKSMTLAPAGDPDNLYPKVLGYDISTRIAVNLGQGSIARQCFIEKIQHDWVAVTGEFKTTWALSDAEQYFYEPPNIDITLRPTANGSLIQLDPYPAGAGTNWDRVDDVPITSSDYVYHIGGTPEEKEDRYTLANSDYTQGIINSVKIKYGGGTGNNDPTYYKMRRLVRIGGVNYYGDYKTSGAYIDTLTVNPATGAAWTWAEINGMELGIALFKNGAQGVICYGIHVVVNVTPVW